MGDFSAPMSIGGAGGSGGPDKMAGYGPELGTLDEPVSHTIMRDVTMVGNKMMCVLNPRKAATLEARGGRYLSARTLSYQVSFD